MSEDTNTTNETENTEQESNKVWNLSEEVKNQLKDLMDSLRSFTKEHDLPAIVLVQTENNDDTYAAEGFIHNSQDRTSGDLQMLIWLAHLMTSGVTDPVAQAMLQKLADAIMATRLVLSVNRAAEGDEGWTGES